MQMSKEQKQVEIQTQVGMRTREAMRSKEDMEADKSVQNLKRHLTLKLIICDNNRTDFLGNFNSEK